MFNNCMSIPVVAGLNTMGNGYGNGMMDGGWWCWILLFALFGWGGNGFGFGNGGAATTQATEAAIQRGFDTQTVVSKLDGINNGICSLGYDQLNQMNGINTNILQTGFGITNAIQGAQIASMQGFNALTAQIAECCCENRAAIAQVRYDMATDTCAITTAVNKVGADLSRQIADSFCQLKMEAKDETIAALRQQVSEANLGTALQGTASYIINTVRPTAQPAYLTCNPQTGMVWPMNGYAYTNGCGCNCNGVNAFNNGCGC